MYKTWISVFSMTTGPFQKCRKKIQSNDQNWTNTITIPCFNLRHTFSYFGNILTACIQHIIFSGITHLLKTESGLLKPKQMFWNRRSNISRLFMEPAMSTLLFLAWLSKQKKGSAVLSAVILTIRWQQQQYHFTTSLLCALRASSSFWQTICLGKQCTVNQEGRWYYAVFFISCKKLLKNLPLQTDNLRSWRGLALLMLSSLIVQLNLHVIYQSTAEETSSGITETSISHSS